MEGLDQAFENFRQRDDVPPAILEALERFVMSTPRRVMEPIVAHPYYEIEERKLLGAGIMQALIEIQPTMTMDETATSVTWSLIMVAPIEQLQSLISLKSPVMLAKLIGLARRDLGTLLKTFLAKEHQMSHPRPYPSRQATAAEKCLIRDGGCCVVAGGATPHVCYIIPISITTRKRIFTDSICTIIGGFWGQERNRRLLALLSDDREIDSARNAICLDPLLHHWWRLGYIALEPLEKLPHGTRVRLRWLHKGSLDIRDCRSGHPILNGSVIDLTSDNLMTEVSYDLLQLQWDLLRMAVLCGAADAADDPEWNPEEEDSDCEGELEYEGRTAEEG